MNSLSEEERDDIALNLNFDMIASPNYVRGVYNGSGVSMITHITSLVLRQACSTANSAQTLMTLIHFVESRSQSPANQVSQ